MQNDLEKKLDLCIKNGKSLEEENRILDAIESFEKALSIYNYSINISVLVEIYIKLGDLYQLISDVEKSLSYFFKAYKEAEGFEIKILQVDSLIRIAESYLYKADLHTSTEYAEIADKIINEINYIKGKLDISIYWSKLYYIKKEYYKAREFCNKALSLCKDDWFLYKGRILNILVELYKDISSADEQLTLLNQAYDCFEKANYKRGLMGIINNIASVYIDKFQDYKMGLEYLFKLKELSENSVYAEFYPLSCMNIGEVYYRLLNYEEAIVYFEEVLEKPNGAYVDNALIYTYALLTEANLRLYNYEDAFKYFTKVDEHIKKYSYRENALVYYYKAAAILFTEIGQIDKAKVYIRQALESVEKEDSMIKWNSGIVFEFMKLKEAKSTSQLLDILEAIRYTLSKYKNADEILNVVYDFAVEILEHGYKELAFELVNKYMHMESENYRIKNKMKYVEALKCKCHNSNYIKAMEGVLELAIKVKDIKMQWRIYNRMGEYYTNKDNVEAAEEYYLKARNIIKNIISATPEDFNIPFINYDNN
jgi:tetratricopeptide (TPR) repeat protein